MIIAELNSDEVKSQSSKIPSSAKIKEYLKSEISLGEIEPLNSKPVSFKINILFNTPVILNLFISLNR